MPMPSKALISFVALALIGGGVAYYSLQDQDAAAPVQQRGGAGAARSAPVEVARVTLEKEDVRLNAIGTLTSDENVDIAAEIAGRVSSIAFNEGRSVKQGDVLVTLDDALLRVEVQDTAAKLKLAEANFSRANTLSRSGTGTTRARDEAVSELEISRAAHELAKVRLDKATLRAPFDGVVGLRRVSSGAFVQAGTAIVNLEKIDRLKVDFRLPEVHLNLVQQGMPVEIQVDAYPGATFKGSIYALDPAVDVNGRAIRVRAELDNADGRLKPGLFARVVVPVPQEQEVIRIPESGVVPQAGETFVYRVKDNKAEQIKVVLGRRAAGVVDVLEGLNDGDVLVTAGHLRLRNGATVDIVGGDEAPQAAE